MKNVRVHPNFQRMGGAYFMIKQAETYKPEEFDAIIVDTHSDNQPIISLFRLMGYEEIAKAPLYDSNREEAIYMKRFERTPSGLLIPIKKFISSQKI
jgi:ribosomal protein S18 acetylase RimI-like enzyme